MTYSLCIAGRCKRAVRPPSRMRGRQASTALLQGRGVQCLQRGSRGV
jgi:hypothetical protein